MIGREGPAVGGGRAVSVAKISTEDEIRVAAEVAALGSGAGEAIVGTNFDQLLILLAQAENGGGGQPPGMGLGGMLLPMLAIGFLFYFLLIRPQRRDQKRRQDMLSGVKKNDRVVTIGGIYGVVTNVHREADEVTVKVDETTNTKLRVTLGSIARILGDELSAEASSK